MVVSFPVIFDKSFFSFDSPKTLLYDSISVSCVCGFYFFLHLSVTLRHYSSPACQGSCSLNDWGATRMHKDDPRGLSRRQIQGMQDNWPSFHCTPDLPHRWISSVGEPRSLWRFDNNLCLLAGYSAMQI